MAKKKITGQSKLATAGLPGQGSEDLRLVARKPQLKPTSFRLTPEDKDRLKRITAQVNDFSPHRKISETLVIKAMLFMAARMKPERLFKAIREVML